MSPECVCEVSAQKTTQWAAAPCPLLQNMAVFTVGSSDNLQKIFCLVLMIMSIMLKSCIFNHISLKILIYGFLSAHTQKMAVTQHVSTKLSYLSCLIVLKHYYTHKFMRKTYELQKSQLCRKVNSWERNCMFIFDLCAGQGGVGGGGGKRGHCPLRKNLCPLSFLNELICLNR